MAEKLTGGANSGADGSKTDSEIGRKAEELYAEHKEAAESEDRKILKKNIAAAKKFYENNLAILQKEASAEYQTWAREEINQSLADNNLLRAQEIWRDLWSHLHPEIRTSPKRQLIETETLRDGQQIRFEKYEYDDKGNLKRIEIRIPPREYPGGLFEVENREYDDKGREIRRRRDISDGGFEETTFKYDDRGRLVERLRQGRQRDITSIGGFMTIYDSLKLKFDKNGKKIEEDRHVICGAGFIHVTTQYEYGESGKLSRSKAFCGGSVFESEYRYDEKGRLIKIETLQDGKYSGTTYYDYDKRGNLIDISKYGKHPSIEKYGYDSKGQLKKKTYEYGESLNTYEYDENGNIAREIHKEYGEVKRTFEYRRKYKS